MTVSQTADYALRAVIQLALTPADAQTTQQLSAATQVPQSYLPKVLQPLARAGIVSAQRGSRGGYKLQQDSHSLTVLAVVSCVDPLRRIKSCPSKLVERGPKLCALHKLLDEDVAATMRRFSAVTINDLLHQPGDTPPLCPATEQKSSDDHAGSDVPSSTTPINME